MRKYCGPEKHMSIFEKFKYFQHPECGKLFSKWRLLFTYKSLNSSGTIGRILFVCGFLRVVFIILEYLCPMSMNIPAPKIETHHRGPNTKFLFALDNGYIRFD
jgi:hypothetical protein